MLHIEAEAKAELVFSHLSSVQQYVRDILRPTVRQNIPPQQFLLEAMSTSFVTRKVLVDLNTQRDQYLYRRVALSPRNPASAANEMERGLIYYFQRHPEATTYRGYREIDGVEHFVMARPVHFEHECMSCHGDPKNAPRVLIERYGAERGFGRQEGELAGLDFVGMPVDKSVKHIRQSITLFGGSFFAVAAGVFLLIVIFFNRLVVTNLRRLSGIFRENFTSPKDQSILDRLDEGDEIHSLLEAFGAFATHLRDARAQLEDYAANLEHKVRCRTADLSQEAAEHKTDVRLFVEILGDLNRSQDHAGLLGTALPRIAERFGATRAAYLCAPLGRQQYAWPGPDCEALMPRDWVRMVNDGQVRMEADRVFVPVSASDFNRGLMGLFWESGKRPEVAPEILLALGQQLGIAIENLEAIDALLRQNRLLELIFEGISDPLLLVDESGSVVLANSTARALAEGIRPGSRIQTWFASISAPAVKDGTLAAAIAGAAPSSLEFELPGQRTLAVSVYPLSDGGGMELMGLACENQGIVPTLSLAEDLPLVKAGPELIKQCLINLVKNAVEAMPAGGRLAVRTTMGRTHALLEVEDTGQGIAPELRDKIFSPFFSTKGRGSGLGLSMTKKTLDDIGGTVELFSVPGEGTRVTLHLPPQLAVAKSGPDR